MRSRRMTQLAAAVAANPWVPYFISRRIYQGPTKGICFPGLNCRSCPLAIFTCPIGALQHSLVARSYQALAYVLGTLAAIGALAGRLPCGWICPFGLLQDLLYKIPLPKLRIPRWATFFKYGTLGILALALPFFLRAEWFSRLCPAGTLEAGLPMYAFPPANTSLEPNHFFWLKVSVLAVFLLWMMVSKRPFCRTACPLGAIWSLFNPVSLYRMEVDHDLCNHCRKCRKVCPVDINIFDNPNSPECIRCLECKKACPRGAVSSGFRSFNPETGPVRKKASLLTGGDSEQSSHQTPGEPGA